MQPESEIGNVEYKLKLLDDSRKKIEQLATQMKYRCYEGNSECIYNIGVEDDGTITGITEEEYEKTISILNESATLNNFYISLINSTDVDRNKKIYQVLVREKNENNYIEIRIAVAGSVDCGKCLSPDTIVIMYDGSKKQVKDVIYGDSLLGDDLTIRNVSRIYTGISKMYEIIQDNGIKYKVTENHILTLQFPAPFIEKPKKKKYDRKYSVVYHVGNGIVKNIYFKTLEQADSYLAEANNYHVKILDISVKNYNTMSKRWKSLFYGFRINNTDKNNKEINKIILTKIMVNKYADFDEYFGFELDNNGRFLLEDGTVTHNSSLLGVLVDGKLDNARGSARLSVFNFSHEVKSGRTSSISHNIIGFNEKGEIVNHNSVMGRMSWPEIVRNSSKIISFLDLAGHEKYLKTTITGLSSSSPDLCFIMISANRGVIRMTQEHIFLCITLKIPFVLVISKIDLVKDNKHILTETYNTINKLLKYPSIQRLPIKIETTDDIITASKHVNTESIVPIFQISNVTGEGLDKLTMFLNILEKRNKYENLSDVEYYIDTTWTVQGVGTVVGGFLASGTVSVGDKLYFGPINGGYEQVTIRSIHCKKIPVQKIECGTYVCFGLKKFDRNRIRRGKVLVSGNNKIIVSEFVASIKVLKTHSTTIRIGYEPILNVHSIRQRVKLVNILEKTDKVGKKKEGGKEIVEICETNNNNILQTGDNAKIKLKFVLQEEFIKSGMNILLCEGHTKVVGTILSITKNF